MAINVDVRIGRLVPNTNEETTVLAVVKGFTFAEPLEISSNNYNIKVLEKLSDLTNVTGGDNQTKLELEYLLKAGLRIILFQPEGGIAELTNNEFNVLSDDLMFNYRFITLPGTLIEDADDLIGTGDKTLLDLVNKVDAELVLNVKHDLILTSKYQEPKVSAYYNSGIVDMSSDYPTELEEDGIPASLAVVVRRARMLLNNTPWIPIAGEQNGLINEYSKVLKQIGNIQKDAIYEKGINPVIAKPGIGAIVSAQNTGTFLKDNKHPLARAHVVTTLIDIQRKLKNILEAQRHALNNSKTWSLIKLNAVSILKHILDGGGIEAYDVLVGLNETMTREEVRNGLLKLVVRFTPVNAIQEIELVIVVEEDNTGYEVNINGGN